MGFPKLLSSRPTCYSPTKQGDCSAFARPPAFSTAASSIPASTSTPAASALWRNFQGNPSHPILRHALTALTRLEHRGAVAADGKSSDGVGVTTAIPARVAPAQCGLSLDASSPSASLFSFCPADDTAQRAEIESALFEQDIEVLTWRPVRSALKSSAKSPPPRVPKYWHLLVTSDDPSSSIAALPGTQTVRAFRSARLLRRASPPRRSSTRRSARDACSADSTLTWPIPNSKPPSPSFISDMQPMCCPRGIAPSHSAASLTTARSTPSGAIAPAWKPVPPPSRSICIRSYAGWFRLHLARRNRRTACPQWPHRRRSGSHGRSCRQSRQPLLVPSVQRRLIEPWDGPAALAFTDGHQVGAILDRNGLRPCRFALDDTGLVVAGSEAGLVDMDPDTSFTAAVSVPAR